jgi:hypothetical protein
MERPNQQIGSGKCFVLLLLLEWNKNDFKNQQNNTTNTKHQTVSTSKIS